MFLSALPKVGAVCLIIVLGFCVYGNSIHGEFIWDDHYLVQYNAEIKSRSGIVSAFVPNQTAVGQRRNLYRPLLMLTYMLDYSLWKLDVRGYHLTNILLHILATLAVYWFINLLYRRQWLSLLTALLFLTHPIHAEVVAYISGRADSLALFLMLLAFIFYLKDLKQKKVIIYILMLTSYFLALLSRENAVILPGLLLLYHLSIKQRPSAREFLPIFGLASVYILVRLTIFVPLAQHLDTDTTVLQRIPGFFAAIISYLRLLVLPFDLHMEYGDRLFSFSQPQVLLGIGATIFLLIYACRRRNARALAFFGISWFFVSLLPASNIYPTSAYMAEHWLYLPAIGFFLIVARGLSIICSHKKSCALAWSCVISLLAFYSTLTIRQNNYWREPFTFYQRTLKYSPQSHRIYNNLAAVYQERGQPNEAIVLYKRAIALEPNHAEPYNNLAAVYQRLGKQQEAIALYQRAIALNPNLVGPYCNLALTYSAIGRQQQALVLYKQALAINPAQTKELAPANPAFLAALSSYRKKE